MERYSTYMYVQVIYICCVQVAISYKLQPVQKYHTSCNLYGAKIQVATCKIFSAQVATCITLTMKKVATCTIFKDMQETELIYFSQNLNHYNLQMYLFDLI